jgi:RimJ/RimL family protein N-acetyltransferase
MLPAILRTARLTLRPPQDDDAEWIAREIARPEVHQMLTSPPRPYGLADAKGWIGSTLDKDGVYVICAGTPLGIVDLGRGNGEQELGYWLQTGAWGQGYMTEAAQSLVAEWFGAYDGDLVSGHLVGNSGSAGVLRKLGFGYEASLMRHSGFWGREVEVQRMRLTRANWARHSGIEGPVT